MNPQSEKSFHYLKCAVKRALENFGELFLLNHIDTRCVQWQHAGSRCPNHLQDITLKGSLRVGQMQLKSGQQQQRDKGENSKRRSGRDSV